MSLRAYVFALALSASIWAMLLTGHGYLLGFLVCVLALLILVIRSRRR